MAEKAKSDAAKTHEFLSRIKEAQAALIKKDSGNSTAMRKCIALDSDMAALQRIVKRTEDGWYEEGLGK
jgi:hypothetical protein